MEGKTLAILAVMLLLLGGAGYYLSGNSGSILSSSTVYLCGSSQLGNCQNTNDPYWLETISANANQSLTFTGSPYTLSNGTTVTPTSSINVQIIPQKPYGEYAFTKRSAWFGVVNYWEATSGNSAPTAHYPITIIVTSGGKSSTLNIDALQNTGTGISIADPAGSGGEIIISPEFGFVGAKPWQDASNVVVDEQTLQFYDRGDYKQKLVDITSGANFVAYCAAPFALTCSPGIQFLACPWAINNCQNYYNSIEISAFGTTFVSQDILPRAIGNGNSGIWTGYHEVGSTGVGQITVAASAKVFKVYYTPPTQSQPQAAIEVSKAASSGQGTIHINVKNIGNSPAAYSVSVTSPTSAITGGSYTTVSISPTQSYDSYLVYTAPYTTVDTTSSFTVRACTISQFGGNLCDTKTVTTEITHSGGGGNTCGNNVCDSTETHATCPIDCESQIQCPAYSQSDSSGQCYCDAGYTMHHDNAGILYCSQDTDYSWYLIGGVGIVLAFALVYVMTKRD